MKYFENGTKEDNKEYLIFTRGYFDCDYNVKKGDLLLEFNRSKELKFFKVLGPHIDDYPYMDFFEVDKETWSKIKKTADEIGGETKEAIDELDEWVTLNFMKNDVFAILGIE